MHLLHIRGRNTLLEAHRQDALSGELSVDAWDGHISVALEDGLTALGILRFQLEVELAWQADLELLGQPTVLEVWEDGHCAIGCELNEPQVTGYLLLNPFVLDLDCDDLTGRSELRLVHLTEGRAGQWLLVEFRINIL